MKKTCKYSLFFVLELFLFSILCFNLIFYALCALQNNQEKYFYYYDYEVIYSNAYGDLYVNNCCNLKLVGLLNA